MKKIYLTLVLATFTLISFSQPFYVYTAQTNGAWSSGSTWNVVLRTDGINKNKVIIPNNRTVSVDNTVNGTSLGDVEIQIAGRLNVDPNTTFTLTSNSNIQLLDGLIKGSSGTQLIYIGSTLKYSGALDGNKTGNSIADNTTGTAPNGFRAFSLLPVNFTSFYIAKSVDRLQLNWSTDRETQNSHFEIERSYNGTDWKKIAVVFGAGNSNNSNSYSYNDENVSNAIVYYRLRQVDTDGRSVYSSIKSIRNGEMMSPVKIYGTDKKVVIELNSAAKNNVMVSVLTTNGQVISKQSFSNPGYKINVELNHISGGAYIVQVTDNKGWNEVKKVVL